MGGIFGGSKSKQKSQNQSTSSSQSSSRSWNNAYPQIQEMFGGTARQTGAASDGIAAMLGLGGDTEAQNAAFDNFLNNSGYSFVQKQGMDGITGNRASKGLLNSGATAKALAGYNQNLTKGFLGDYMDKLFNLGNMGMNAGQLISGAGQESTSNSSSTSQSTGSSSGSSKSKPGIGGFLGSIGSGIAASDRRLKNDVEKIGELADGLSVYRWVYTWGKKAVGVMADEVAKLRPYALGPVVGGYATVDYSKLEEFA